MHPHREYQMKTTSRLVILILFGVVVSNCTSRTVSESINLSPEVDNCTASRYLPILEDYLPQLGSGTYRSIVSKVLEEMAEDIFSLPPIVSGRCEVSYTAESKSAPAIYDISLPVQITISEGPSQVCLTHDDPTGSRQSRTVENTLNSSTESAAAKGSTSPICFNK